MFSSLWYFIVSGHLCRRLNALCLWGEQPQLKVTEVCNRPMELPLCIFITRISCDWLLAFYIAYFTDSYCILPVCNVIPVMIIGITRNVQNWSSCCLCLVMTSVRWKMYKLSCINEHLPCASDIKLVLHVTVNDDVLESIIHIILKGG